MRYGRFLVLLEPIILLTLLELTIFYPKYFYWLILLANFSILLSIYTFFRENRRGKSWPEFASLAVLPVCFISGTFVYASIISNKFFLQTLFLVIVIFSYSHLRMAYKFFLDQDLLKKNFFKNQSGLGNLLAFFFSSAAIYGLQSFLNLPIWILMLFLLVITALLVYQALWVNKIELRDALLYVLVSSVVLLEIGWAATFLPLNYNVLGVSLTVCYYVLIRLVLSYLSNVLDGRRLKVYLSFGFLSILLVFLTSRWM